MLLNCGVGEDSWESLGLQGDQTNPKGDQSWIFIGRTDAEVPILWPLDVSSQLIRKDLDDGKDWRQEERGTTEDEMVGWYHHHIGHEFEQAPGDGEGQGSLVCYSPWGHKESDMIEWLNDDDDEEEVTEDENGWWHHPLNEHDFEPTPGDSVGQENLVCCSPWHHKESDITEQLNNSNNSK